MSGEISQEEVRMKPFQTVAKEFATDSFIEKKSEFIAYVKRVSTEDEAKNFVMEIKAKHADARHNCYAYRLRSGGLARQSDDGEPSGTAGMPILEVLEREDVTDVCVVVTRYFGGILLGAGGLTRAYARGAKMGLDAAGKTAFVPYTCFTCEVSYADYEKLTHKMPTYGVLCDNVEYGAGVLLSLRIKEENFDTFAAFVTDMTGGKVMCVVTESAFGPDETDGENKK